jgi:hypothetical protein
MTTTEVTEQPLRQAMLDTTDVFILDAGAEIFVWIGKGATPDERKAGMQTGQGFIEAEGRPAWTAVGGSLLTLLPAVCLLCFVLFVWCLVFWEFTIFFLSCGPLPLFFFFFGMR